MSAGLAASPEELERGRWLFAQTCEFVAGAASPDGLPPPGAPEVAFAGRSNVGKSSLLNALTGRRDLARTSKTPGRTQQINFFDLKGRLTLVDLPGYGFALAPKDKVAAWTEFVRLYLRGRAPLRRVCLLVDARHGLKPIDREVMDMLDASAVSYLVVLTKADLVGKAGLAEVAAETEAELARRVAAFPGVAVTSAAKRWGLEELRAHLAALAETAPAA